MNVHLLVAVAFVVLCFATAPLSFASVVFGIIAIVSGRDKVMKNRRSAIWVPAIVGGVTSVQSLWILLLVQSSGDWFSAFFTLIGLGLGIASMSVSLVCFVRSR
jgi:apolipoprotein N-acyltransferase